MLRPLAKLFAVCLNLTREREAVVQAMLAAYTTAVPVRFLIDNEAIVRRLLRGLRVGSWNGDAAGFWFFIVTLVLMVWK